MEQLGCQILGILHWVVSALGRARSSTVSSCSFRSSAALAFAFGMAVTGTITITTLLYFYLVRKRWGKPLWVVLTGGGAFLTIELLFLAAKPPSSSMVHGCQC